MESAVEFENVSFSYSEESGPVFSGVSASLPAAMMAVVGQNGIGKSTLLLLASGRLTPDGGTVRILGTDTGTFADAAHDPAVEQERNRYVSFVYQNMEFETQDSVGNLMEHVYENGFHEAQDPAYLRRIQEELEMTPFLGRRTQELSKGQLQRAIIGFSLLYGSRMIMLDEPVFAMEEAQKDRAFGLLMDLSREHGLPVYYSVHNLDISGTCSDYLLLFEKSGTFAVGPTKEMFTRDRLEAAYQAPLDTLYLRDRLYRDLLLDSR